MEERLCTGQFAPPRATEPPILVSFSTPTPSGMENLFTWVYGGEQPQIGTVSQISMLRMKYLELF